jgi:hypothetical protein
VQQVGDPLRHRGIRISVEGFGVRFGNSHIHSFSSFAKAGRAARRHLRCRNVNLAVLSVGTAQAGVAWETGPLTPVAVPLTHE